jgi:hypothetical protein
MDPDPGVAEDRNQLAFARQHCRLEVERTPVSVRQQRQQVIFGAAAVQ